MPPVLASSPRRRDEDDMFEGEEHMDTLSELYITGARARGDGLANTCPGRPIWLQGRDRKQAGGGASGAGTGSAGRGANGADSSAGADQQGADGFAQPGGRRRSGPPGLSSIQSTVHIDLPSPEPKMLSSTAAGPFLASTVGGGMGGGRGRRGSGGGLGLGGITGSAIRGMPHDPVRESWDSLSFFARGHAGRLAPSMAVKLSKNIPAGKRAAHRVAGMGGLPSRDVGVAEEAAAMPLGGRMGGKGIRDSSLNRLGSAPVEGRGDGDLAYPPLVGNRQVNSAHGYKDPSIRLDLQPFHIPVLPAGRHVRLDIITTWGDPHYVGLSGIVSLPPFLPLPPLLFWARGCVVAWRAAPGKWLR